MVKRYEVKTIIWMSSTKRDIQKLPEDVKDTFGFALHQAQIGDKHVSARPLKGYSGAGAGASWRMDEGEVIWRRD